MSNHRPSVAVDEMNKEATENNARMRTYSRRLVNAHTNVVSINLGSANYVLKEEIRSLGHKLGSGRIGLMRIIMTKSDRKFGVEEFMKSR